MIAVMQTSATPEDIEHVLEVLRLHNLKGQVSSGEERTVIGVIGTGFPDDLLETLEVLPGVDRVTRITRPYKLASRDFKPESTIVKAGWGQRIGGREFVVMAGPCSVESRGQLLETAASVAASGATVLRGGAFKPRTSPYSFQGLGVEALRYLAEARDATSLPVITEAMEPSQVDIVAEYADIIQIGARNMQNYSLLNAAGRVARPVMLKRGFGATLEELLMAAEYIVAAGNPNVILCERGIRTFEASTRNTMDLSAVPVLHQLTHLPVVVDPSHATGKRWLVPPLAMGGVAVGADGVMVEVHPDPDSALSDPEQQLDLAGFARLMTALRPIHEQVREFRMVPA
jgi:3-deoxy-7-phosphoheptulonate synthase